MLEVVSSPVWQNPMVENVKFANNPRVEPALRKGVDEDVLITNLHVTNASPAFVLVGGSGTGKTNEMCALAEQLAGDHLVLFFNGAELYGSLARTLTDEFNWHFSDQLPLPKICERLAAIAERLHGNVVILLDAVDEAGVPELPRELSDLTTHLLPLGGRVKVIVSLKTELWGTYARIMGSPSALSEHCFKRRASSMRANGSVGGVAATSHKS